MTVSTTTSRVEYAGDGSTVAFAVPFYFLANADLRVYQAGVLKTITTHYTVSGAANPAGGTVTFVTAPASDQDVVIFRDPAITQETDYIANDPFPAESHERALDKLTMIAQRIGSQIDRAVTLADGSTTAVSLDLPDPEASHLLGWNQGATGLQNFDVNDLISVGLFSNWLYSTFTGDGTTATFTLSKAPASLANIDVSIDGVTQVPIVDFGLSGAALTFTTAPPASAVILARHGDSAVQGTYAVETERQLAAAAQTLVTLTQVSYVPGGNNLNVYLNGVRMTGGVDYTETSSTSLTFANALTLNDEIVCVVGREIADAVGAENISFLQGGTGAVSRSVANKLREQLVSVKDFGAIGDNATNDTAAIQAALTAVRLAGGGEVFFPAGTYLISSSLYVGSRTRLRGVGRASVLKASSYVGVNTGVEATTNCQMLQNYNHTASTLTDEDIAVEDLAFDWNGVTISGGGAHCIAFRYVNRVLVRNVYATGGENVTALRACRDTTTDACVGINQSNCFFDHWDGAGTARVENCTGRSPDVYIAQGIQFTGTGSYGEDRSSSDCVVTGCSLYRVRTASGQASAIISNANDPDSAAYRFTSIGNYVEDADNGIVFSGEGGQHLSMGDTLRNVTISPILMQSVSTDEPAACRVLNAHLIDCDHSVSAVALVAFQGVNNEVRGLKVTNTTSPAYDIIGWFGADANNCLLEIDRAASGAGARVQDNGTDCRVIDSFDRYQENAYVPTLQFGGATTGITYTQRVGYYTRVGNLVQFTIIIELSSKGSATGTAQITLPFTSAANVITGHCVATYAANMSGLTSNIFGQVGNAEQQVLLNDGGATGSAVLDDTNFANNSFLYLSGMYRTAT